MRHVVMFSGGVGSWAAAKRVVERHGAESVTLLFTDTSMEDPDLYRFLDEAAVNVFRNMPPNLVWIADGRTPWQAEGIQPPRLYAMGFAHNNCGGKCCKAGQGQWALLLRTLPESYAEAEREEEALRGLLGNVSMLTDRTGDGLKKPLAALRERIEAGGQVDIFAIGGCGCFVDETPDA